MYWFTSDSHFGHRNIIRYSNRPFRDVRDMDDCLIQNINDHVRPGDTLFHLGDFAFSDNVRDLLARINCKDIHLIYGNHDKRYVSRLFRTANDVTEVYVNDRGEKRLIVCCHYAMRVWRNSHHGAWHLYGHSHGSLPDDPNSLSFDVGVDCHNYTPLSFDDVKRIMNAKTWKPVDHHGAREHER